MWIAKNFDDYTVIDCGDGEKLERWGDYYLVRPEPQAIWSSPRTNPHWKKYDALYSRSSTGGGSWTNKTLPSSWQISYKDLKFNLKPMNFKHTGIFPEQASNWDFISDMISNAGRPINVLNLFAYTGAATIVAAKAGASVCHVDAAKGMVAWARENAASSGLSDSPIRWIVDDCAKFVEREIRRGRKYDAIIMDPPSYGRGPTGEIWKFEENIFDFIKLCSGVLSDAPLFVLMSSYTTGVAPSVCKYIADTVFTKRYGGKAECDELGLKVSETGLILPAGSATRWYTI